MPKFVHAQEAHATRVPRRRTIDGRWQRRVGAACVLAVTALFSLFLGVDEAAASIAPIELGDRVTGTLDGEADSLPLFVVQNTKLKLVVDAGPGLYPDVTILGPDGIPVPGVTTKVARGGMKVAVRVTIPAGGLHTIVVAAQGGSAGTYSVRVKGKAPSRVLISGRATGGPCTAAFGALAGSRLRSIKVKRLTAGLDLNAEGDLQDPDGASVPLGSQSARGKTILVRNATLTDNGTHAFVFTPVGLGPYTSVVRLKPPRSTGTLRAVPPGNGGGIALPATGVAARISTPPNGTHFVAGDAPWVIVTLQDDAGSPVTLADLSRCNLYVYGPQDQSLTTTAVKLLRASTDRNARPHHYIDLRTNPDVVHLGGNVIGYPLSPVTDELPGTYSATAWTTLASDGAQQWMPIADFQIGTATPESLLVEKEKCGACHEGAASGKFYLHHIDPGYSPIGNPSLDSWPTRTCKSCHNQDGYAGYNNGAGTGDSNVDRTPDPIIRRIHGVHMGKNLQLPFNNDPDTGDFHDYIDVTFPADVRDCARCHVDDSWKTKPSQQACGACHDSIWFGSPAALPGDYVLHSGGAQADGGCDACHPADGPGISPISEVHADDPSAPAWVIELDMSAPAGGGEFYTAGDTPKLTFVVKDPDTLAVLDPATFDEDNVYRMRLLVSGPRAGTGPVLTTGALGLAGRRASVTSGSAETWDFSTPLDFDVELDGIAARTLNTGTGVFADSSQATADEVAAWLSVAGPGGLGDLMTISTDDGEVSMKSNTPGAAIIIGPSDVATEMDWPIGAKSPSPATYPSNDLRIRDDPFDDDPRKSIVGTSIEYQLDDVTGLEPGTYTIFLYGKPERSDDYGIVLTNFQVGTATEEAKPATGCKDCHGDTNMHGGYPFEPDLCKSCHDYGRDGTGLGFTRNGGDSTSGWSGFGSKPLSSRIHGVHRGTYLEYPEEVYPPTSSHDYSTVIFPQDIRNCIKCHPSSDRWTTEPARLPCLGCHDGDATATHAKLMTYDPTPDDPWSGDEEESCKVCHGRDADFAPSIVHNVWDPYQAPYPREPEDH